MNSIEVVVNVPIRRTFRRDQTPPPPSEDDADGGESLQTYHYHLPPELESVVVAGHLVWAPFGSQEVQAVVLRRTAVAPVPTKAILRLARPEPVLTPAQIELAAWIAESYVAPFAEAIRLFLPPGLLSRTPGRSAARSRRETRIELALPANVARTRLSSLGRASGQACVLAWLMAHRDVATVTVAELLAICDLRSDSAIQTLRKLGAVSVAERQVALKLDDEAATELLLTLRGADKYCPIVDALAAAGQPLWRHELHALTPAPLPLLRDLQAAGIVTLREEIVLRDPLLGRTYPITQPPPLTSEQAGVWQRIVTEWLDKRSPDRRGGATFLLHGVTGSGKTEIYLRAIDAVIRRGQQAIVLVPEIALTPQTVARFAGRFPGRVTVIHSALSTGERYDVWRGVRAGNYDVVIGPRSALFAPVTALGLIIIDEEHEGTYKQDAEVWGGANVFYDARIVARRMAAMQECLLIAGSATPSLESYFAAQQGDMILLEMAQRVMGHRDDDATFYAELPRVEVVDMRQELRVGNRSIFSRSLSSQLISTLEAGEQAILFLNRRGTNTFILCRDCGYVAECKRCAVPLTYHTDATGNAARLVCHHCNRVYPVPEVCPACKSKRIRFFGAGTERIEEAVKEIVPAARVLRWDADTTARKGSHEQLMATFAAHEADILIGTQMIAKGLDLPLVTLVGVVSADIGLFLPDFRSSERTFQLLTQVAGRAGRGVRGGRVVIQSYRPDHYVIQAAARHDYQGFYARELNFRREHGYPPLRRLARLIFWEKRLDRVKQETQRMATVVKHRLASMGLEGDAASLLGPAPAFFERYRGYYRWQLLLRAPDPATVLRGLDIPFGWRIDIDPLSLL